MYVYIHIYIYTHEYRYAYIQGLEFHVPPGPGRRAWEVAVACLAGSPGSTCRRSTAVAGALAVGCSWGHALWLWLLNVVNSGLIAVNSDFKSGMIIG